jgi:hypothetical protein
MRVSRELKPVPPDHPMFTRGVGFVFRSPLPPEPEAEQDESESEQPDEDES